MATAPPLESRDPSPSDTVLMMRESGGMMVPLVRETEGGEEEEEVEDKAPSPPPSPPSLPLEPVVTITLGELGCRAGTIVNRGEGAGGGDEEEPPAVPPAPPPGPPPSEEVVEGEGEELNSPLPFPLSLEAVPVGIVVT